MINKKNMWFLTLFSLILVLSVYYVTMPSELLLNTGSSNPEVTTTDVNEESENASLVALRVEKEEESLKQLDDLNAILTSKDSSVDDKNTAYDKMKNINNIKGEESSLESKIKEEFKLDSVVKIDGNNIKVTASSSESSVSLANQIMRSVQSKYNDKMYITVKFEN